MFESFRYRYSESKASVVILEEDGRTRYVPPEPTVKILKRPQSTGSSHLASGDNVVMNGDATKPRQPVKTLQQVIRMFFFFQNNVFMIIIGISIIVIVFVIIYF